MIESPKDNLHKDVPFVLNLVYSVQVEMCKDKIDREKCSLRVEISAIQILLECIKNLE